MRILRRYTKIIKTYKQEVDLKILVVRFSSIGDIVLTTPVIRALKNQISDSEIHFLTKVQFSEILRDNPNVDRLITINKSIDEVVIDLKEESYDYVIDLHNNIRTASLKRKLGRPSKTFKKLNWKKGLLVKLKVNQLPNKHVVDRYFDAVLSLGVLNDNLPGDFIINQKEVVDVQEMFKLNSGGYLCVAIGAQFRTKQMPKELLVEVLKDVESPIVLIGGEMDHILSEELVSLLPSKVIIDTCGQYSLQGSASIVSQSLKLITNDTGMMHIAACLQVPIVSVWGNTVPAFGMYPYYPKQEAMYSIHEVGGLSCRPCSKIGYQKCPKGHFKCMNQQNSEAILRAINS